MLRSVIALAGVVALSAGAAAATKPPLLQAPEGSPAAAVAASLARPRHPWLAASDLADVRDSVRAFYARRGVWPCWTAAARPTARARAWIEALSRLDAYGLSPDEFDAPRLADTAAALAAGLPHRAVDLADFDVGLSASIARTLRALHGGRVKPALLDSNLILLHRRLPVSRVLDSLSTGGDPRVWIERVQPGVRAYWLLLQALGRYRAAAQDASLLPLPVRPPRLREGHGTPQAGRLRRLLILTGDLARRSGRPPPDTLVDQRLINGLKRFQRRYSLPPTGRADDETWALLGGALNDRIEQMERSLELWRWLPHDLPTPLLLVNIPAFRLEAVEHPDQSESTMLTLNVVVGKAFRTQTPVLTAALTSVDFAPDWDVPPGIARDELRPKAAADSVYLRINHMVLFRGRTLVGPTPEAIEKIGDGVRVQQQPGPDNPLGRVKFVMPNRYDVYLHDTPARELFQRRQRDFSHGCIRVGDAPALARFALRERPDWTAARIDSALAGVKTLKVRLPRPILVAIVYATAEAREDGGVVFHRDVYGHDRALELLLEGAPPDSVAAERARAARIRTPPAVDSSVSRAP